MQKGQIARQWRAVARSGMCWGTVGRGGMIGTIKCKKVKLLGSGMHWHAVVRNGMIGTIKCKKVKLLGSGAQWGDWDN